MTTQDKLDEYDREHDPTQVEPSRCWFCGVMVSDDSIVCGGLKCRTELDDLAADDINRIERLIRAGVWKSLSDRCRMHPDHLSWIEKWFYTAKLLACCLFGWHKCMGYRDEPIDVVEIDFHRTYAGWDQTWLRVGGGVFANWNYELAHDSDWNM